MKKLVIIGLATFGLALGAFAQGAIVLDNSTLPASASLTIGSVGNFFSGTYGLQVYILNGGTVPGNINNQSGISSPTAYANMLAAGYTLQKTYLNQTITPANAGVFQLGEADLPGVTPKGGTTTIALVAWQGSGASFSSAPNGGVITFQNPTSDYTATPALPAPNMTGWASLGQNLLMTPVPEPSIIALAGLGAAALMGIRRRK